MSWYAYCLTEHPTLANGVRARRPFLLEGIQGVNSAPVMSYPSGEFAVIVSEYDRATSKLDEKSVLEHARVVSQSFRTATVLPFRFGTIFDTEDAIRQAVRSNRRTFCESVERLRGKSEMRIKLTVRDGSLRGNMEEIVLPDTVGREYLIKLREKASRERERQTKARRSPSRCTSCSIPWRKKSAARRLTPTECCSTSLTSSTPSRSKNIRTAIARPPSSSRTARWW
jgi:hypothetical protein